MSSRGRPLSSSNSSQFSDGYHSTDDSQSSTAPNMSSRTRGPNAELSDQISQLSKWNTKLERLLAKIGTKADTPDFRDRMHREQQEATQLVKNIMSSMKDASADPRMDKSLFNRLSSNFKKEFQTFQRLQGTLDEKQIQVMQQVSSHSHRGSDSVLQGDNQKNQRGYDPYAETSQNAFNEDPSAQLNQQLLSDDQFQFLEFNAEEIERRTHEIHQIERQVSEVAEMFQDLQSLVYQQQEHIDIIDNNIVETKEKTEAAAKELLEAEEYQAKARRRKCCVLMIVLAIIGFIVLLVYVAK